MQVNAATGAAEPALGGRELAAWVAGSLPVVLEVHDVAKVGGSQVTPQMMMELAARLDAEFAAGRLDGAVITQGTDGIEESAYLLDLVLKTDRPVVHTGAMRNQSELGFEGARNLAAACRVAASEAAVGLGVLVVMDDAILAAHEVVKTDAVHPASFAAPGRGPLGVVTRRGPVFFHQPLLRRRVGVSAWQLETRVDIVMLALGMTGAAVRDAAIRSEARGLVIVAAGAGNVPDQAVPAIVEAVRANIPVVLTSRVHHGSVDDIYGYPGGGYELRKAGVIMAPGLTAAKARIALMVLLAQPEMTARKLKDFFEAPWFDEFPF